MFVTRITCDKNENTTTFGPDTCPYLDVVADKPEDIPAAFTAALAEAKWSTSPRGYHCPRHNPDLIGQPLVLSADYIEPIPGIHLRLRPHAIEGDGQRVHAELLLDKTRYDLDVTGHVWRAKHVSERWPT